MSGIDSLLRHGLARGLFGLALLAGLVAAPGLAAAQETSGEEDRLREGSVPGRLERTRSELRTEKLIITVDREARGMVRELGVREYLRRLLITNDIPVNGLLLDPEKLTRTLDRTGSAECYHVVYPAAEKSNTICL